MYKVQIFNFIVNKTAEECNVTPEEIRSTSHREDIVKALSPCRSRGRLFTERDFYHYGQRQPESSA